VLDQYEGHAGTGGQMLEQFLEGFQTPAEAPTPTMGKEAAAFCVVAAGFSLRFFLRSIEFPN
jgi:hypothetical protein